MSICWWCHWGWPQPIFEIFQKAVAVNGDADAMCWGPAHVVWEDENWDLAQCCLDEFDQWVAAHNSNRFTEQELEVVRQSLVELIAVPSEYKQEPECYEGENPEKFPPPNGWKMFRLD